MIRKALAAIAIMIVFLCSVSALTTSEPVPHYMYGQIRFGLYFDISINESVLPFDLDGSSVRYNENWQTIATGLIVGTYRLSSNNSDIYLTCSHTPLRLRNNEVTEHNQVNYRLYLMTEVGNQRFYSTTGSEIEIHGSALVSNGMINLIDKYIYVSLDEGNSADTAEVVENLAAGTYESTITFEIWVER